MPPGTDAVRAWGATAYVEVGRHSGSDSVTLDIDVWEVTVVPADLAR